MNYPKNREELIKQGGVFTINDTTIEVSNLYNRKEGNYSGGFGKSYMVSNGKEEKVFNDFDKAINYMKKLNNIKENKMSIKKLNQQIESLLEDSEVREWEHNGRRFKEIIVDTKEVEVIPGLVIKFNKIELGEDDVYVRTTWELDKSVDLNAVNEIIAKHIIKQLDVDNYRIGGWSGAIPLIITTEED